MEEYNYKKIREKYDREDYHVKGSDTGDTGCLFIILAMGLILAVGTLLTILVLK